MRMKQMKKVAICLNALCLLLGGCRRQGDIAPIRVSFLNDDAALADTVDVLRSAGISASALSAFERSVRQYYRSPFTVDLKAFPSSREGFYEFPTIQSFVKALPYRLVDADHDWGVSCFDIVVVLCGEALKTSLSIDSQAGPFFAPTALANGAIVVHKADTPRAAFAVTYPSNYVSRVQEIMGIVWTESDTCRSVCLQSCLKLPGPSPHDALGNALLGALKQQWAGWGVSFPSQPQIVLLHSVEAATGGVFTGHGGLLIRRDRGYIYVEKAGGFGPFLRLDVADVDDLTRYYGSIGSHIGSRTLDREFMTINDEQVFEVEPHAVPLRTADGRIIRE